LQERPCGHVFGEHQSRRRGQKHRGSSQKSLQPNAAGARWEIAFAMEPTQELIALSWRPIILGSA
jgi:hypothetical protein